MSVSATPRTQHAPDSVACQEIVRLKGGRLPMIVFYQPDGRYRVTSETKIDQTYIWDDRLQMCDCPDWEAYGGPDKDGRGKYPLNHLERLCKHGRAVRRYQQCVVELGRRQPTPAQILHAAASVAAPVVDPSESACRSCGGTRWKLNASGVCAACFLTGSY